MAFTEQNKADAYLFFVLAFNAAPGTVYGGQIVEAYESGMTTAEIVAQYVEKTAFTNLYPTTQTANEFATALVNNVSSLSTKAAVKAAAVADIETALAAGWTKAQVVTQILGNLANKTVADAEWGATVAQLNNKIAVAKALTEGDLALTTEDAALLQGPLANVTEDLATVEQAIKGAGALTDLIQAYVAAQKAQADFQEALDLDVGETVVSVYSDAAAEVVVGGTFSSLDSDDKETVTAATQNALVAAQKVVNAEAVKAAKAALDAAKVEFLTDNSGVTKAKMEAYLKAVANNEAAEKALGNGAAGAAPQVTDTGAVKALNKALDDLKTADDAVDPADGGFDSSTAALSTDTGTVAGIISVQSGKLALVAGFVETASPKQLTAAQKLLEGIVAWQTAVAAATAASDALDAATDALGAAAANTGALDAANEDLLLKQKAVTDLDAALKAYSEAAANLTKSLALDKAVEDAKDALDAAGIDPLVVGTDAATLGADVFLVEAASNDKVLAGFAGADKIYAGKGYVVSADVAKGDDAKLEVFFKANGSNTDVYIEQKTFGSNSADTAGKDIIKITLTGVAADKLVLKDGFVQIAA